MKEEKKGANSRKIYTKKQKGTEKQNKVYVVNEIFVKT